MTEPATASGIEQIIDRYIASWNETDPAARRALIARIWTEDGRYLDPLMSGEGHDGIDAMIGGVQTQFPGFRFRRTGELDAHHDRVRLECGQLELHTEALDLRKVAQEAAERAQVQTDHHQIRVEMPETSVIGVWDRMRLEEVVDNLVGNAIKYSPEGGEVLVQVAAVAEEARLRVVDQGTGIVEEALPRVFEQFHRADITGTPGLGLGLYIARMLVEAHGGRIQVASAPGRGSTFTVHLPLIPARQS